MSQPYISVVVPTYRSSHFITQTLDALAARPRSDVVEVVMVDDGSSDETFSTVRNWTANSTLMCASWNCSATPDSFMHLWPV